MIVGATGAITYPKARTIFMVFLLTPDVLGLHNYCSA